MNDNINFLAAAYVIAWGGLGTYIIAIFLRFKHTREDISAIQALQQNKKSSQ